MCLEFPDQVLLDFRLLMHDLDLPSPIGVHPLKVSLQQIEGRLSGVLHRRPIQVLVRGLILRLMQQGLQIGLYRVSRQLPEVDLSRVPHMVSYDLSGDLVEL